MDFFSGNYFRYLSVDTLQHNMHGTNFHGWRRVWGENRGRTGGGPGENRGRPKEPGENRGHLGREPGENRGFLVCICKEYRGRSGGFGIRTGGEPGGGIFFETRDPTRDLKINEQDRP